MSKTDDIASGRKRVDEIDTKMMELLAERFRVTRQIGTYKVARGIVSRDPARESSQLTVISKKAEKLGLNPELARHLLQLIIAEAVKEHHEMQAGRNA